MLQPLRNTENIENLYASNYTNSEPRVYSTDNFVIFVSIGL